MAVQVTRTGVALVVGITLLALATFGALYLAKQQGDQARRQEAAQIAENKLREEAKKDVALTPANDKPAQNTQQQSQTGQNSTNGSTNSNSGGASNAATELPQTGMSSTGTLLVTVLLGAVTYLGVHGVQIVATRRSLDLF